MAEKLDMVRMFHSNGTDKFSECTGLKIEHSVKLWPILRWGEWCRVKFGPLKFTILNNGGIQLTGLKETPTSRMDSYVVRDLGSRRR